jgi:hypothetical protein
MQGGDALEAGAATPSRSDGVTARARRRRLKRVLTALLLGVVVSAYTLGALDTRTAAEVQNDPIPPGVAAAVLGIAFLIGSLPVAWSFVGRIILPVPTFFVFLTIFIEKEPPLPFYAAFALSICYAAALTVLSRHLADRPGRPMLGTRSPGPTD